VCDLVGADGTSYSVLVEEVEAMFPASYADEPLGSDGKANPERQDIIVSGPQFAALVKLPQSVGNSRRAHRAHQSCRDRTSQTEVDQDEIAQGKAGEKAAPQEIPEVCPSRNTAGAEPCHE
jgi:hypothetical protein